jgi:hypothetical protein
MGDKIKTYTLDEVKDKFIGKKGTLKRKIYEFGLQMYIGKLKKYK